MSYSVVIADDEPLVLIGLQDMIDWQKEGFEIVGQARNGAQLAQEIEKHRPDLVITDIRMPVRSGMEVLEQIRRQDERLPLFIFLTSYEEFDLIKKAMSLEAVDYIVKLELDRSQLTDALDRAKRKIVEIRGKGDEGHVMNERQFLQERYFMRQLFSIDTHDLSAEDVGLDMDYDWFTVAYITLPGILSSQNRDKDVNLFYSAYRLIESTVGRYTTCYLTQLDLGHIAAILPFRENARAGYRSYITSGFMAAVEDLKNYFSLEAEVYCGPLVNSVSLLSDSFFKAKLLAGVKQMKGEAIMFFDHSQNRDTEEIVVTLDSEGFTRAFGELNAELLRQCTDNLVGQIRATSLSRVHAMDLASSILYMAVNLVPDAPACLEEIFPRQENMFSYRSLYQAMSTEDVIAWLERLCDGFVRIFNERRQDYRMQTIQKVQAYIQENVSRRLTLGGVASIFGYSQNYLSSLFSRYASTSFVDYVNNAKIEKAKKLLADPNAMVYEVALQLGFESPFYFSKVFKKVTGMSPTTYQNNISPKGDR